MAALDTLTGQQRTCAVLAAILATPGLPDATWTVYPDSMCSSSLTPQLRGQLSGRQPIADLRAAIDAYFLQLDLSADEDQFVPGDDRCAGFAEVSTSGLIDGVYVKVWGAAQ